MKQQKNEYANLISRLKQYAAMHEDPPYGRSIEGEEELEREAALAIEKLQEQVELLESNYRAETPLGALIVRPSGYGLDYPGIWIDLRRGDSDCDMPLALVEYTATEVDLEHGVGHIITRVYGNDGDEYTHRIVHTGIEEYFRMEEAEPKED